jgi:hypothetical protein
MDPAFFKGGNCIWYARAGSFDVIIGSETHLRPILVRHVIDGFERKNKHTHTHTHIRIKSNHANIAGQEMEKRVETSQAKPLGIQPLDVDRSSPECHQTGNCARYVSYTVHTQTRKLPFRLIGLPLEREASIFSFYFNKAKSFGSFF